jgi:hypothetical protein
MAEPFWSQPDAVKDEVAVQEEGPAPTEPQARQRVDEQVIEGPAWKLVLGLVCFAIVFVTVVVDVLGGGSEPGEYAEIGFVLFMFSIVLPFMGYMEYNTSMVISWDTVSHHLNVAFASRQLEGRKTFFSYNMQPGDDVRFESHTEDGVGEDSSSSTSYWLEIHRQDGTVAVDTPVFRSSSHYWNRLRPILLGYQGKVNTAAKQKETETVQASSSGDKS